MIQEKVKTNNGKQLVTDFLKLILTNASKQVDALLLKFNTYNIIEFSVPGLTVLEDRDEVSKVKGKTFDLVFGELFFGDIPSVTLNTSSRLKVGKNWEYILTSLRTLKEDGEAFFFVEPKILYSDIGMRFLNDLSVERFYYNSVFELPEKLFYPETSFVPIILHFERQKHDKLFIAKITDNYNTLFESFNKRVSTDNLESGVLVDRENFRSFNTFRIENEINNLKMQYKEYDKYKIKDIAVDVRLINDKTQAKPNSIYISTIGTPTVVADIDSVNAKWKRFFRVELKEELVRAQFLALFFRSELGRQVLKSTTTGDFIPHINKSDIEECLVSVPKVEKQDLLVRTSQALSVVQGTMEQLNAELSLNPENVNIILEKIEDVQVALKQVSGGRANISFDTKG